MAATQYGTQVPFSKFSNVREFVTDIERTGAGNVRLRIGRQNKGASTWEQVGYVVLTADARTVKHSARALVNANGGI